MPELSSTPSLVQKQPKVLDLKRICVCLVGFSIRYIYNTYVYKYIRYELHVSTVHGRYISSTARFYLCKRRVGIQ